MEVKYTQRTTAVRSTGREDIPFQIDTGGNMINDLVELSEQVQRLFVMDQDDTICCWSSLLVQSACDILGGNLKEIAIVLNVSMS